MKRSISASDVMELSVAERIELVEDLWDTIAEVPEIVELTEEQKRVLDERLEAYHKNPDAGSPWEEVKNRIRSRR
jgi:putative addiction module component (TIGR02574 family)